MNEPHGDEGVAHELHSIMLNPLAFPIKLRHGVKGCGKWLGPDAAKINEVRDSPSHDP
jgi:hypothetical protein